MPRLDDLSDMLVLAHVLAPVLPVRDIEVPGMGIDVDLAGLGVSARLQGLDIVTNEILVAFLLIRLLQK